MTFRSGFACFVGRPNAGKSTLTNALVGSKVAITSSRPQTTRHAIRGILHRPDAQLVVVDTPGLHKPRTLLGQRLNDLVRATWSAVDVIGLCVPADEKVGPGDRFIARELARLSTPVVGIVTKTDAADPGQVAEQLVTLADLMDFADLVPVSAVQQVRLDTLVTTRRELALDALLADDSTFYGDLFPHAVQWEGDLYLEPKLGGCTP